MQIIKGFILLLVWASSCYIGLLIAKKYKDRVLELREMKVALNMFETKAKFTYEPIPNIFAEIAQKLQYTPSQIFREAAIGMKQTEAGQVWEDTLNRYEKNNKTAMKKEDIEVLKGLSKLLGKVDLEGQLSEIALVSHFLEKQIELAEKEKEKNEKLFRTLGATAGTAIVVILL